MSEVVLTKETYKTSFTIDVLQSITIAFILTVLSYFVGIQAGWIKEINWLEAFAVATSYSCTWLCVKQRRFNYPIGVLSTIAYAILFYQADLLASMAVNIYLTPTLIYGWLRWNRDETTRPVQNVKLKTIPLYLGVSVAFYLGALWLVNLLGGTMAPLDSVILVGTILAQFLLDNKKIETWFIWAGVNIVAIYVYMQADLALAAFQYVFFLINTGIGYAQWRRTLEK